MSKTKKISIIVGSVLLVAALIWGGLSLYRSIKEPALSASEVLPDGLVLSVNLSQPFKFNTEVLQAGTIWNALCQFDAFAALQADISALDSLLSNEDRLRELLSSNGLTMSVHFGGNESFVPFFVVELPRGTSFKGIRKFMEQHGATEAVKHKGISIQEVKVGENSRLFYYLSHGIFAASTDKSLLIQSTDRIKDKSSWQGFDEYMKAKAMAGGNVDNVVLNHRFFARLLIKYANTEYVDILSSMPEFLGTTELDFIAKSDSWMFSGYTIPKPGSKGFFTAFENQNPTGYDLAAYIPSSSVMSLFIGFSDAELLSESLKPEGISSLEKQYSLNVKESVLSWMKGQAAFFVLPGPNERGQNKFLALQCTDPREAAQRLEEITKTHFPQYLSDTLNVRSYTIRRIGMPDLWSELFGSPFSEVKANYYVQLGEGILFANDKETLGNCISSFLLEKSLSRAAHYQEFSRNITPESNIYLYINYPASPLYMNSFLNPDFATAIAGKQFALNGFNAFGLQMTHRDGSLYTNILLTHSGDESEVAETAWEAALDASAVHQPFQVIDHNTRGKKLMVFDAGPSVYMFSLQGEMLWKTDLPEIPVSDVATVDFYKNERNQFLFNSENYLFLIDINGKFVDGFPVRLPFRASAGLTLLDYEGKKDYRILIPSWDKTIQNLGMDAKPVKGWQNPKTSEPVVTSVRHFVIGGKDFLVIADSAGNVVFANRRGEVRIKPVPDFTLSSGGNFFKEAAGNRLITTDVAGRVVFITAEGVTEKKQLAELGSEHLFLYADLDGDGVPEFIFSDGQTLWVYNSSGDPVNIAEPGSMSSTCFSRALVVKTAAEQRLVLVGDEGKLLCFSLSGNCPEFPDIRTQNCFLGIVPVSNEKSYLITARGRIISCHPF